MIKDTIINVMKMKLREKRPRCNKLGNIWEETGEVQLWEDRDRWTGLIARCPQKRQYLRKMNNEQ
jgi:hypothetical protein